jgi:CRISPR/Cas system-associated exonuclease Cas4 (RecB family)
LNQNSRYCRRERTVTKIAGRHPGADKKAHFMGEIIQRLDENIRKNSGIQYRDYLGLSQVKLNSCKRQLFYEAMPDAQMDIDIEAFYKCREGYLRENDLIEQLCEAGFAISHRNAEFFPFPGFKKIRFHIEGIIRLESGWHLLEIKHRNNKGFEKFRERIPFHIYQQIQGYLNYTRRPYTDFNISRAVMLVKNIDSSEMFEKYIVADPRIGHDIDKKVKEMRSILKAGKLPNRDYQRESTHCQYCVFAKECWR